jgi:hypothetical protein
MSEHVCQLSFEARSGVSLCSQSAAEGRVAWPLCGSIGRAACRAPG